VSGRITATAAIKILTAFPEGSQQTSPGERRGAAAKRRLFLGRHQHDRWRSAVSSRAHVAEIETECGLFRSRQTAVVLPRDWLDRRIWFNTHPGHRQRSYYSRRLALGWLV